MRSDRVIGTTRNEGVLYRRVLGSLAMTVFAVLAITTTSAVGASPDPFWTRCVANTENDVQCSGPRGIASSPVDGHVFIADAFDSRIAEFTAWGKFVRAWGWGVVKSGPDNDPQNEIQEVVVDATAGNFELRLSNLVGSRDSTPISFDASAAEVQAALEAMGPPNGKLPGLSPGDVTVGGPAGGPWTIEFTGALADTDIRQLQTVESTLSGGGELATVGTPQGGANFEICVPSAGDSCRPGQEGSAAGQFSGPQGIAIDSAGNVYAVDRGLPSNQRVLKFSPSGQFLRMWGKGVNEGTAANKEICTNAGPPEEICRAGGEGIGPGQFEKWPAVGSFITIDTHGTQTAADDNVYVGDVGRIQRFNTDGEYEADLPNPEGLLTGKTVTSLAVVPSGNLFVGRAGTANVLKLNASSGEKECEGEPPVTSPEAIAADAAGNAYVVAATVGRPVRKLDSSCKEVLEEETAAPFFPSFPFTSGFSESTGIATGSACLSTGYDLYVANSPEAPNGFVRAFGPPPDKLTGPGELCEPPPHAPEIEGQGAVSVETDRALVQAKINPRFWNDTSYYVQYATAACIDAEGWEASCISKKPTSAAQLGAGTTDVGANTAKVLLANLTPGTPYRYRFAAQSSGGGPVFGKGGTEALQGKAASFTTTIAPPESEACPNKAFRAGAGAFLPDCRAYEMVSPVDKNGVDIRPAKTMYFQTSPTGNASPMSPKRLSAISRATRSSTSTWPPVRKKRKVSAAGSAMA